MRTHLYHILATVSCWWLSSAWLAGGLLLNSHRFGLPPATDPDFANVVLLLHCDGVDGSTVFLDSGNSGHTITFGPNSTVDTAQSVFGGACVILGGATSYLSCAAGAAFEFPGDFTIEFWMRSAGSGIEVLFDGRLSPSGPGLVIYRNQGAAAMVVDFQGTRIVGGLPGGGIWTHLAVCRAGTSVKLFLDGVQSGATWTSSADITDGGCVFGIDRDLSSSPYSGWLDDIRITNGVSRYDSSFAPPATPFPDT